MIATILKLNIESHLMLVDGAAQFALIFHVLRHFCSDVKGICFAIFAFGYILSDDGDIVACKG